MDNQGRREVEHEVTVNAPAAAVYRLIAEVENWPLLFPPSVYVDQVERLGDAERIRIWATANDEVKSWTSRRMLDPDRMRVDFRQEVSTSPVAEMGGTWLVEPLSADVTRLRLLHDYRAIDDDPAGLEWIDQAVDKNSRSELAALKINIETASGSDGLLFSFADSVQINGSAKDAYDFLNEAHLWRERLPHVARVVLTEETPGLQTLEMDTRTKDGATHITKSVRVCFPHHRIVYKQITLPALMNLHTGYWELTEEQADGDQLVTATSQHTVVLKPENITSVLGPGADIPQARDYVRRALSTNSLATLGHAKAYAEARR